MQTSEEKSWLVPLFIFIVLAAIVFGVLYYISTDFYEKRNSVGRNEFDYGGKPVQSKVTPNQVILTKNERLDIDRMSLVYRGVEKKRIIVDLYLLDLDPKQAYEKQFLKKDAKRGLQLGDTRYSLISVNKQHLILKLLHE